MSPPRREFDERHPPSDSDKSKLAILWDERHDCERYHKALGDRLKAVEDWMIEEKTLKRSSEKSAAWRAALGSGLILVIVTLLKDLALKNWG